MIPARRASRTEPIEALRDAAVETVSVSRGRIVTTVVMLVLGALGLLLGTAPAVIGLGALLLFVGVIVAGPIIARWGTRLVTPVMSRLGLEGRLAADNTARNPKRTATTANALLIGVFLVTLVTVAGTSAKDFVVSELEKIDSADYLVVSNGGTLDDAFVTRLEAIDGIEQVSAFRREPVTLDGEASLMSTADTTALVDIADIQVATGSLAGLEDGTVALIGDADGVVKGKAVGDTVTLTGSSGRSADLRVVATIKLSTDSSQVGSLVSPGTFDRIAGDRRRPWPSSMPRPASRPTPRTPSTRRPPVVPTSP